MSLNTQRVRHYAAIVRIIAGGLALILVIGGYVRYAPRVRVAIHEADKLAGNLNEEIKDAVSILTHVNESVSTVRASVPPLTQTLASTTDAVGKMAGTINGFSADSDSLADVCNRTSAVCETFEKQLPIKVPAVTLTTKTVSFNVPEVIPKTKPMSISYPTATAHTGHKDLRYPSGANVKMGHVHVAGHSIDYPDGLDVSFGNAGLDYPDRLDIGNGSVVVQVPDTSEFKANMTSVEVPDKLAVTYRELMKSEKEILQESAGMLSKVSEHLHGTRTELSNIATLLNTDALTSLGKLQADLQSADGSLKALSETHIPGVINKLNAQIDNITNARDVFKVTEGLIPLVGIIAALIPVGMISSGLWKWTELSHV